MCFKSAFYKFNKSNMLEKYNDFNLINIRKVAIDPPSLIVHTGIKGHRKLYSVN